QARTSAGARRLQTARKATDRSVARGSLQSRALRSGRRLKRRIKLPSSIVGGARSAPTPHNPSRRSLPALGGWNDPLLWSVGGGRHRPARKGSAERLLTSTVGPSASCPALAIMESLRPCSSVSGAFGPLALLSPASPPHPIGRAADRSGCTR